MTLVHELLTTLKSGQWVPPPVLADACTEAGLDHHAAWVRCCYITQDALGGYVTHMPYGDRAYITRVFYNEPDAKHYLIREILHAMTWHCKQCYGDPRYGAPHVLFPCSRCHDRGWELTPGPLVPVHQLPPRKDTHEAE